MTSKNQALRAKAGSRFGWAVAAALAVLAFQASARAQTFNSGSTGADGAFDLSSTPSGTTVEFDPAVLHVGGVASAPLIDLEHDNVFNFTTITIPSGVTVHLSGRYINGPVYWLATGAVNIAGTVNLNGEKGADRTQSASNRRPSVPGPGGFPGGVGGNTDTAGVGAAQPGAGPGGGAAPPNSVFTYLGQGGTYIAGKFLVPLTAGSGGGGGVANDFEMWGASGGAGGGAILIASSVSISVSGAVLANGGAGGYWRPGDCYNPNNTALGGGGSGGGIRLAAPIVQGSGSLQVSNGGSCYNDSRAVGEVGRVRIDAFQQGWSFSISGNYTTGSPVNSYVPTGVPGSVQVTSIAGVPLPPNPTGSFDVPDTVINNGGPVTIQITAHGVPVGTVANVYLLSLEGSDQTIAASPLVGTQQTSTATATATFPSGLSRGYVRAKW
jgi:hypothetical protein